MPLAKLDSLRDVITKAYRLNETDCLNRLVSHISFSPTQSAHIHAVASQLVENTRKQKKKRGKIDALLHQYDLSTEEGISLMCLAEALLRIPDKATVDQFIADKLATVDWKHAIHSHQPLFINAASWSLLLTGKIYQPLLEQPQTLFHALKRAISRLGIALIRPLIFQMMKTIGQQFVMGQDIHEALTRSQQAAKQGYRFSYDMLGEAARTKADADHYYTAYLNAIHALGKAAETDQPALNAGISIKLSALHPRYEYTQHTRIMETLPPRLLTLAQLAKQYQLGLTVDAEEADRLDLSLDIFEQVFKDPSLKDWNGLGLAVQAYQKRAFFVIDWLAALAKQHHKIIMVRLVKGAYWDTEIKLSQTLGLENYPTFTRKDATDVSYLACAQKLLSHPDYFYAQFGTHNAYSVAAILEMADQAHLSDQFEFQCLHGMGRPLYDQIIAHDQLGRSGRIYAPVGTHQDLLGYLVRRLLENGANSSFVNRLADDTLPIDKIVYDPIARMAALTHKPHPRIPLPKDLYGQWQNAGGIDLSNSSDLQRLQQQMKTADQEIRHAASIVNGEVLLHSDKQALVSPGDLNNVIAYVCKANEAQIETAIQVASSATRSWAKTPVAERAAMLERAATLFQENMPNLISLLNQEGGKCIQDGMAEVRETIDFCRYYAYRARLDLAPVNLPGPTGETNQLTLHPRGIIACISPWNFPLAIFTGQILAALVTGNTVVAKPAEQTPLSAFQSIQILHEAGIPKDVLQLLIGQGSVVGHGLTRDPRVAGVMFTGSTDTAKRIEQSLANRQGQIAMFIAETGGQNAMIVDSSALPEQLVLDIAQSAFNSAGQRCSALRILFIQEEIAQRVLDMLKGYMAELSLGDPSSLATDIGPVIDQGAKDMLTEHVNRLSKEATLIAQVPHPSGLKGHYFAPAVFELKDLTPLKGEVFGPILHVIRYPASELEKVMDTIINTGFGLTLGIHSRIEATVQKVIGKMPVGNIYVNRNMIGAVVGVQPFGGERLSGTGPKAGGPHYLPRLCVERVVSTNTTAVGGNAQLVSLLEND